MAALNPKWFRAPENEIKFWTQINADFQDKK
jgi:hypothetical protein